MISVKSLVPIWPGLFFHGYYYYKCIYECRSPPEVALYATTLWYIVRLFFDGFKSKADYAAYKEAVEEPLARFKFNTAMIADFKENLMPEISSLIG
ncbi:MAG: hypothetical protein J6O61_15450 [Butyrivibrio sp.]|uniref:hypothetical protein n=1 Tax=Butyrivibrio sp. TaxID=28121 RepID=UPI001B1A35DC|nr:hypothetical protein [Butyrivibrio sp.]MBO6242199.1 hypothetical protein [Butyrivibrio sp.]